MSTGDNKLDEFESMFRSALADVFHYQAPALRTAVLVSDGDAVEADALLATVQGPLQAAAGADAVAFEVWPRDRWAVGDTPAIPQLLTMLEQRGPDVVIASRGLLGRATDLPYTLGSVVDTLSQGQPAPLWLLPTAHAPERQADAGMHHVLAVTHHLQGDDELVSWAAALTAPEGSLYLAHIEDDVTLQRTLSAIERIREIDTDVARRTLGAKLLEMPRQYIDTVQARLHEAGRRETVVPIVRMGHALSDYRRLVDEHAIDLVVVHGRDDRQRAMHGLAHALAVELRDRPLLLL